MNVPIQGKQQDSEVELTPEYRAPDGDAEGEEEMSDAGDGDVPMVSLASYIVQLFA